MPDASDWCDYISCDVWHGDRPLTPDGLPLVGQLAPGLFINAGHGFNGWRDAGITAKRVAALVAGGASFEEAIAGGNKYAGKSVTRPRTQSSYPTSDELPW